MSSQCIKGGRWLDNHRVQVGQGGVGGSTRETHNKVLTILKEKLLSQRPRPRMNRAAPSTHCRWCCLRIIVKSSARRMVGEVSTNIVIWGYYFITIMSRSLFGYAFLRTIAWSFRKGRSVCLCSIRQGQVLGHVFPR